THFTFFTTARTQLLLYGFFGMTMFGAIYYIVPLLTQSEWPSAKWADRHFTLAALGIALYVTSLALGGVLQGRALNDPNKSFHDALIFLGVFFALALSWFGLVFEPQLQLGNAQPATNVVNTAELYPQRRPGLAKQGLEVYRSLGCASCHSQQVGQTGRTYDVVL